MNPLDALFQRLRADNRKAFLPFVPAGDPDLATTARLLPAVAEAGASAIEVGFPFSDPIADAQAAGLCGAVVPDLPAEEADDLAARCRERDFKLILLVTPTTSPERAERVVKACGGFVYVVSVVGITGERDRLPDTLHAQIARLRQLTDLPLCVGFGVSTPAHVRQVVEVADGVIVGTALVKKLAGDGDRVAAVSSLVRELVAGLGERPA